MAVVSISAALALHARRRPDAVAVRCGDEVVTRAQLERESLAVARAWRDVVVPDSLVTICLPNGIDFVRACCAVWRLGATPQPLSVRVSPEERAAVIALARPSLVVDGALPAERGDEDPLPDRIASSWKAPTSSGSTGRPKIVRATVPATIDPDAQVAPFVPRRAVQLVTGPLTHGAAFVYAMRGLMTGHELVVLPRFDAGAALAALTEHRVTWSVLSPAAMHRIWRLGPRARAAADVSALESVLHLGARCAPWLKRAWIDWLGAERVIELYAGTEAQGLALVSGEEWLARPGTVGRPVSGSQFRVVGPDGRDRPPGQTGEILMRRTDGPGYEYLGAGPKVRDGWHTLGDLGHVDEAGYLFVEDRIADAIDVDGVTVLPADVEAVLEAHPAVRSAVAVARSGRVHAIVDTAGARIDVAELSRWAAARLRDEQRPGGWDVVAQPLRDEAGKVRRTDWAIATR